MRSVTSRPRLSRWTGGSRLTDSSTWSPTWSVCTGTGRRGQRRGCASAGRVSLLVDVAASGKVVPGMSDRMLLHCGPASSGRTSATRYAARCVPPVSEGWAKTVEEADRMLADGTGDVGARLPTRHGPAHGESSAPRRRSLSSTTRTVAPGRSRRSTRDRGDRLVRSRNAVGDCPAGLPPRRRGDVEADR